MRLYFTLCTLRHETKLSPVYSQTWDCTLLCVPWDKRLLNPVTLSYETKLSPVYSQTWDCTLLCVPWDMRLCLTLYTSDMRLCLTPCSSFPWISITGDWWTYLTQEESKSVKITKLLWVNLSYPQTWDYALPYVPADMRLYLPVCTLRHETMLYPVYFQTWEHTLSCVPLNIPFVPSWTLKQ